ncbi:hypothetical protein N9E71_04170 [Candidatus Pelagibacter sp.]|nr:hypothetical protein [Candidatus Pelagibacter sp.]
MKLDINLRLLFSAFFLILLASIIYPTNSNAQKPSGTVARADSVACGGNGTAVITDPGTTSCELQPDIQKINFLRVDFCTAEPTAPTTSAPLDRSNCSTFYRNDNGSEVTVQQGAGTQIGTASDYSAIPHGTYTYGVVTMGTVFKYTASKTFSDTMTDTGGGGSTTTCVTRPGSNAIMYGWHDGQNAAKSNVSCAANAVASEISIGINTMAMSGNNCKHLLNFNGTNGNVAGYLLEADDTLHDDVPGTDIVPSSSDGCTSGTNNEISKIMGVMTFGTPIEIAANTVGIEIEYNNTQGLKLDLGGDSSIYKWDVAFFDFTITAKKARSRGSWR